MQYHFKSLQNTTVCSNYEMLPNIDEYQCNIFKVILKLNQEFDKLSK